MAEAIQLLGLLLLAIAAGLVWLPAGLAVFAIELVVVGIALEGRGGPDRD